jgi:hypothetical protein
MTRIRRIRGRGLWTDFMSVPKYNRNPAFHKKPGFLLAERAGFGYHPHMGAREPE